MLEIKGIYKKFQDLDILKGVDLAIQKGDIAVMFPKKRL